MSGEGEKNLVRPAGISYEDRRMNEEQSSAESIPSEPVKQAWQTPRLTELMVGRTASSSTNYYYTDGQNNYS